MALIHSNDCEYHTDRGCKCSAWVDLRQIVPGEPLYCTLHKAQMLVIDALEREINNTIKAAREK